MLSNIQKLILSILTFIIAAFGIQAQNPIIQTLFTADPAPLVYNDTLFLFVGHDEDNAPDDNFVMKEYLCFSTIDMVNLTHHGPVFTTESLGWAAENNANAAQVAYRNNKFYYYISPWSALPDGGDCIAVGVSDSPFGPFKDAIGKPLISPGQTNYSGHAWEDLDPTVFIDDDGQAYLYWGNNALYCVKLNEDMISYSGDILTFDIKDTAAFGPDFEEAPWLFKHESTYYLFYAAHIPEAIYYTTSNTPLGPWKYGGVVMDAMAQDCMSNHPGVIQYKGYWYLFYQNQDLPNGIDKRRCINVMPFNFNPDGSISKIPHSKKGVVNGVGYLNPFQQIEAETMAWAEGIEIDQNRDSDIYVTDIDSGDYIKVRDVDFAYGAKSFEANVASAIQGGKLEIRIDSLSGIRLGIFDVPNTSDWNNWITQTCTIENVNDVHDIYFLFTGGEGKLFNFNWWSFSPVDN